MSTKNDLNKEMLKQKAQDVLAFFKSIESLQTFWCKHSRRELDKFAQEYFNISFYYFKKIAIDNLNIRDKTKQESEKIHMQHTQLTCLERYGVTCNWASKDPKLNGKATLFKRYGVTNNSQLDSWKAAVKNTYANKTPEERRLLVEHQLAGKHNSRHITNRYKCNGYSFDSFPEVAFYIYMTLNSNYEVKRETTILEYNYNNKIYNCVPDFEINGQLYEIKANYWLKDRNNPDSKDYAKYNCLIQNNVKILFEDDYKFYVNWCLAHDWTKDKFINDIKRSPTAAMADLLN